MSQNVKLNPYNLTAKYGNFFALNSLISRYGGGPPSDVNDLGVNIADVLKLMLFNSSQFVKTDEFRMFNMTASTINDITSNSWCKDCCANTFESYNELKERINEMGIFTERQLLYMQQLIGMPCNYAISNINDFLAIISQLEVNILIEKSVSLNDKNPLLLFSAISKYSLDYWITNTGGSSPWLTYLTPGSPIDYIRPLWLASILGSIMVVENEISKDLDITLNVGTDIILPGIIGSMTSSASYAFFH